MILQKKRWLRSILLAMLTVAYLLYIGIYIFPERLPGVSKLFEQNSNSDALAPTLVEVVDENGDVLIVQMAPTETPIGQQEALAPEVGSTSSLEDSTRLREVGPLALRGRDTPVPEPAPEITALIVQSESNGAPIFTAVVRNGPGLWSGVLELVEPQTVIRPVLGQTGPPDDIWYLVETPTGQRGWISMRFVFVESN